MWQAAGVELYAVERPGQSAAYGLGPHSTHLAIAGSLDGEIQLWDVRTDQHVLSYGGHATAALLFAHESPRRMLTINALAWSPDGKRVVLGCGRDAEIWQPV